MGNRVFIIYHRRGRKSKNVFPILDPTDTNYATKVVKLVEELKPNVVHIQHEWGLFDKETYNAYLLPLLVELYAKKIPTVITFHTPIFAEGIGPNELMFELLARTRCTFVVHTDGQMKELNERFSDIDIVRIPHGIRKVNPTRMAKKKLGLHGKIILMVGFITERKGFDRAIEIFPEVAKSVKNATLVIAGSVRPKPNPNIKKDVEYLEKIKKMIKNSPVRKRIVFFNKILSEREFDSLMSVSDVVVLPYRRSSQSGILANSFAFGVPAVVTGVGGDREVIEKSRTGIIANDEAGIRDALIKILKDNDLRYTMKTNAQEYAKQFLWSNVARETMKAYYKTIFRYNIVERFITTIKDYVKSGG